MRPGEKPFEELIVAAFDRSPEPSATRLNAIEDRLARQASRAPKRKKSRSVYWWLILGLAATGAAAWWTGSAWRGPVESVLQQDVVAPETTRPTGDSGASSSAPPAGATGEKRSTTIYRRERH